MLAEGRKIKPDVIYVKDRYLWCPNIFGAIYNLLRVSYYTTVVGDADAIEQLSNEIAKLRYTCKADVNLKLKGSLNPHIYKKEHHRHKNKSVDINITIDALRHTYNKSVRRVYLMSGDGDYIPLIQEIMRHGVSVKVGAFSSGCNNELKYIADDFRYLDDKYFELNDEAREVAPISWTVNQKS